MAIPPDERPAQRLLDGLKTLLEFRRRLVLSRDRVKERQAELVAAEAALEEATREADAALKELGSCPTCFTTVKGDAR